MPRLVAFAVAAVAAAVALAGCTASSPGPADASGADPPAVACIGPCMRILDASLSAWEPSVAVDPRDPQHIVVATNDMAEDATTRTSMIKLFAVVTFDGGDSWTTVRLPSGPEAGRDHPLFRMTGGGDTSLAFLPDGTVLYGGLFQTYGPPVQVGVGPTFATGYSTFVYRSTDGGLTWPEASIVQPGNGALLFTGAGRFVQSPASSAAVLWDANDKPWIATNAEGHVLMAWTDILSNAPETGPLNARCDLVASTSTDGGRSWGAQVVVERGGCWSGSSPVATADGTWHVAYFGYGNGELRVARSSDGGATWDSTTIGESVWMPSLALQRLPDGRERLLLASAAPLKDVEVTVVRWSDDGGASWTDPLRVDPVGTKGRALPAVDGDLAGTAYVTFFRDVEGEGFQGKARQFAVAVRDGKAGEPTLLDGTNAWSSFSVGDYVDLAPLPDGVFSVWANSDGEAKRLVGARLTLA